MKKIIFKNIFFICLVLLVSLIVIVNYYGINMYSTTEIICGKNAKVGEEFSVLFNIKGSEDGILGIQGTINYDKEIFKILDKSIKKEGWMISAFNEETGIFMLEITDQDFFDKELYIYNKEEIVEFVFEVNEEILKEKTDIEISNIKVVDSNYKTIEIKSNTNKGIKIIK